MCKVAELACLTIVAAPFGKEAAALASADAMVG